GNVSGAVPQPVVHLSSVLRSPLLDRAQERLGRVEGLIVRLADRGYPPVTGVKARIAGRELFVPVGQVAALEPGAGRLAGGASGRGEVEPRSLRASGRRGSARTGRPGAQARQRRGRSAEASRGTRD